MNSHSRLPKWMAAISAYSRSSRPIQTHSLHCHLTKLGLLPASIILTTSILTSYSRHENDISSARKLFDEMPHRNTITHNSMISAYSTAGMGFKALDLFYSLKCSEPELGPDEFSVSSALTACAGVRDLRSGSQIHAYAVSARFDSDSAVVNALTNMYFKCGEVECAERAAEGREDDSEMVRVMMINGYASNERYVDVLRNIGRAGGFMALFVAEPGVAVSVVTACANLGLVGIGKQVHCIAVTSGYDCQNDAVLETALISMYCKCSSVGEARRVFSSIGERRVQHWNSMVAGYICNGCLEEARGLFDKMPGKNVVSWTAMMSGYVQHGMPREGLRLLAGLYGGSGLVRGNCFTFASALDACSRLAALDAGKQVHCQALRAVVDDGRNYLVFSTALLDMYSRSGNLSYARRVFDRMGGKNVVSWTSMITGYAAHGFGPEAIKLLEQMMSMGFKPNEVTFVSVLSACSHCGLVEQGMHYFRLLKERYGIAPMRDHYVCLVDMLSRAGRLVEAWSVVEETKDGILDGGDGPAILGALLGGCEMHGNVEIGNKVEGEMMKRRAQISDGYVALSNVYAAAEMWDEVYRVREECKKKGAIKAPGWSEIRIEALASDISLTP
ncbi:pentatricopeptide repeat-containing protein-like [Iris pallida]|uniref:Pentatricopeptide repeat-containing protein-like n=1 Tax=Iris pallida TaxID=29817 RepID=A0AAX6H0W7_IRIPA|nr:pentatricopeptide repeat-containing protein-like [Iris pallida]